MTVQTPPPVRFRGRWWSADELSALATGWYAAIRERLPTAGDTVAAVVPNTPRGIALFFALSALPVPATLLLPDPRSWGGPSTLPSGTPLFLLPALTGLESAAHRVGLQPVVLPEVGAGSASAAFLTGPGFIVLTSGSTGNPRPVYRSTPRLLAAVSARLAALGLPREGMVAGSLPLARGLGLNNSVLAAVVRRSPLFLLEIFDPNALLEHLASGECAYWAGTSIMADLLVRAAPSARPVTACSMVIGSVSQQLWEAFRVRFLTPLRGCYGITETGVIALDDSPSEEVHPGTVGRPVPGVDVLVGDDPWSPVPRGTLGRIWVRSPWLMQGYGVPPRIEPPETRDGWWQTRDVGMLDEARYLTLRGRTDDCLKTTGGHLVNLAEVADLLRGVPGVTDAVVVPLESGAGPVVGALVEADVSVETAELRAHLARSVPAWAHPRTLQMTRELPRLADGRVDRLASIAILACTA